MPKDDCHNSDTFLPEEAGFPAGLSPFPCRRREKTGTRRAPGTRTAHDGSRTRRRRRERFPQALPHVHGLQRRRRPCSGRSTQGFFRCSAMRADALPRRGAAEKRTQRPDDHERPGSEAMGKSARSQRNAKARRNKGPLTETRFSGTVPAAENPSRRGGKTLQAAAR